MKSLSTPKNSSARPGAQLFAVTTHPGRTQSAEATAGTHPLHINLSAARTHRRERRWIRPITSGQLWSVRIAMMATPSLTERFAVETLRTLNGAVMICRMCIHPQPWAFKRITSRIPKQQRNQLPTDAAETDESETHKVVLVLHCRNPIRLPSAVVEFLANPGKLQASRRPKSQPVNGAKILRKATAKLKAPMQQSQGPTRYRPERPVNSRATTGSEYSR